MTGGVDSIVKVVTDADIANAKTTAEKDLQTKLVGEIKSGLSSDDVLLDSAQNYTVESSTASNNSGDQVDTFNYSVKSSLSVLTFSQNDFQTALLTSANQNLGSDKQLVSNSNQKINYTVNSADMAAGTISLAGSFNGFVANKYNENDMKSAIKYKSIGAATTKLTSYPGVLSASIIVSPRILHSLPALTKRITILYNYGN
jgi:hypothetical protein